MRETCQDRPNYPALIVSCREAAGLSQADLARRASVSPATIAMWESPTYEGIDLSILQRVARATGTRLSLGFTPQRSVAAPAGAEALQSASVAPTPEPRPSSRPARRRRRQRSRAWLTLLDPKVA
jgi:transcriptional regulator with XRE-family HTH domain